MTGRFSVFLSVHVYEKKDIGDDDDDDDDDDNDDGEITNNRDC